ncbi:enoyl-CoA hydratase/isomerase family protein [Massilia sp. DJPM01]|uniref:enoyl-CoA hydratase/isomerase family protein n=1 Tax=Massilia sp. DJPM01 TaxID=3024404 RepID=UPI00259E6E89|nr:enoyl-CoA hydratase/isomerase family protein [Massilia sp. DJPM01]MDM5175730.1 enoyl-CoA hydratase/isomerase family protein [Massilia sp. DJPM01]
MNTNALPVRLEERAGAGGMRVALATLDVPTSLHALTLDMIRLLEGALVRWAADPSIACVVLQSSTDKAFCAGGDVRSLRQALLAQADAMPNPVALAFFSEEYRLDHRIHTYPKPVLVWGGGIVMGGGLGLMAGASHRVVTETTRIAMPEISIGLFPDVGGSWFLPRMPGRCGLFLGLTGAPLNAADALFTGLADYAIAQQERGRILDALCQADWTAQADAGVTLDLLLRAFADAAPALPPAQTRIHFDAIQAMTRSRALAGVVAAIVAYDGEAAWLQAAAKSLAGGSPFSAALAWSLRERARHLGLADALRLELTVAVRCCAYPDFSEGVRALLIDKDSAPQWRPPALQDLAQCFESPWARHPLADLD